MSKNDDIFRLRELAIERDEARENLKENAEDTKEKLRPVNLAKRAGKAAAKKAKAGGGKVSGSVKRNPAISASLAATILTAGAVAAFRKPIGKFIDEKLDGRSGDRDQVED